jgi:hypothetical protein
MSARLIAVALLVTATTLFITPAPTPAVSGVICKEKGFRGNSNNARRYLTAPAKKRAEYAWGDYCRKLHSAVWCNYSKAKDKRMICNWVGAPVGELCEAEGTPCRNN